MLQEDQTVSFQPIYEGYQPWFAKLFALYLFIVLIVLFVRSARFIWVLVELRKRNDESVFNTTCAETAQRIASSRRLAWLTVLISVLVLSWWTADVLLGVRAEKTPNIAYILPATGDALTAFTLGIIVAVVAWGGSMWAQFMLNRRQAAHKRHI